MNVYWFFTKVGQRPAAVAAAFALVILVFGFLFIKAGWKQKVMLIWCLFFSLPAVFLAELSPRYFYLPAVGWAVLMAGVVETAAAKLSRSTLRGTLNRSSEKQKFFSRVAALLLYACVALQGLQHSTHVINIWSRGNDIINRTVSSTMRLIAKYPEKDTIIVVDQPTLCQGDDFYGYPLLITPMRTVLKTHFNLEHPRVESYRLHSANIFDDTFRKISRSDLASASARPDTLVIIYDSKKKEMVPYESGI